MYDDVEPAAEAEPRSFKSVFWMVVLWIFLIALAVSPFPWVWL